jgi:hypothetical protein
MFSSFSAVGKPLSSANDHQMSEMSSFLHIQTDYETALGQTLPSGISTNYFVSLKLSCSLNRLNRTVEILILA